MQKRIPAILLAMILAMTGFALTVPAAADASGETLQPPAGITIPNVKPEAVTVTGSHYVAKGKKITLRAAVSPETADQEVTWKSSDKTIATVSSAGVVKGIKKGTVTVTAASKADKSIKKTWKIYVKAKPVSSIDVLAETTTLYLDGEKTVVLEAEVYPSSAAQKVEWKSSDTTIAAVNKTTGEVTAKKAGEVTITAKAVDGSKVAGEIDITVKENTVTYRALLIGEEHFDGDTCTRNAGDVKLMADMLGSVVGPKGGKYKVTRKLDLGYSGVRSAISSAFGAATEKDVSLFFIATHGNSDGDGDLILVDGRAIPFDTLASWLKNIKGKVIVILESCGAGSAIYDPDEENSAEALKAMAKKEEAASKAFVSAAVRAFSAADPGVAANSTGDLREKKFYVLAAARHHEMSWGTESPYGSSNYFTRWLVEGVGSISKSPADKDKNRRITLTELFNYISRVGDNYPFETAEETYYQHVQRYPVGSTYQLFRFK